jgi:hypothetical protein
MGGYFWQEAVSSPDSLVGLEAHDFAVVTTLLSGLDVRDGPQGPGSRARNREKNRREKTNFRTLLSIGYWLLSIGYWLLAIVSCLLSLVYCLLSIVYCLLYIVYYLLSTGY